MHHKESDNYKVEFSQDEFYWFSRRRHWTVCEFFRLASNNKTLESPAPGTPKQRYLKLIAFEIKKGEKLKLIDIPPNGPDDKFIRSIPVPLEVPIRERRFYTDLLSARQAFNFAFLHHYTKVWQNSSEEYRIPGIFPLLMNSKYAVTVSPGFLEMQEEIFGRELSDFAKTAPIWTGLDIVQIVFGPRYKDEKNLKLDPVASFIRLAEGHIQTGNLFPLKTSPSGEFLKATFKPADGVRFIYQEDVFQWLKRQGVDILEWVSEMFAHIEIEAEDGGGSQLVSEAVASAQPEKKSSNFIPASPDTKYKTAAHPAPTTELAKSRALKSKAHAIFKLLGGPNKKVTAQDILNFWEWHLAIEKSGYDRDYKLPLDRLQKWIVEFRKEGKSTDSEK